MSGAAALGGQQRGTYVKALDAQIVRPAQRLQEPSSNLSIVNSTEADVLWPRHLALWLTGNVDKLHTDNPVANSLQHAQSHYYITVA